MNGKRLYKSRNDKKISGVCAGIAEYFGIDPTLIRLLWAVVTLFTIGTGLFAYILCAIIMPEMPDDTTYVVNEDN
ncbi:MAG: PspC domain-containing protein [Oscillospiraceae bacterium]|nr:PspC domain-containing protein [Oscillospiraceae bacterium]